MAKKLIIHKTPEDIQIAVLDENNELIKLQKEKFDNDISVGDVYIGKVSKILHSLNAAFVKINHPKEGFLHYYDLGQYIKPQIKYFNYLLNSKQYTPIEEIELKSPLPKEGQIKDVLKTNQNLVVRVIKEPISTKGARLSTTLAFAGNYLVFMPFSLNGVLVSKKIKDQNKRKYLKKVLEGITHKNVSIIVRTAAETVDIDKLIAEYNSLYHKWETFCFNVIKADRQNIPIKIYSEYKRSIAFLRDLLSEDFSEIIVDDEEIYNDLRKYLVSANSPLLDVLKYKKSKQGAFIDYGIDTKIKKSFGKYVSIGEGAYLIIEKTEALHTIDINSGRYRNKLSSPEETAFKVNMQAVKEIARQLKLRDLGGIIVIDFIDLKNDKNKKMLVDALKKELEKDKAKTTVLPMSRFGLVQITRERVRPEVSIEVDEPCPYCLGTGNILEPEINVVEKIEKDIQEKHNEISSISLHPFLFAYLKKHPFKFQIKWLIKYKKWIKLKQDPQKHIIEYQFS